MTPIIKKIPMAPVRKKLSMTMQRVTPYALSLAKFFELTKVIIPIIIVIMANTTRKMMKRTRDAAINLPNSGYSGHSGDTSYHETYESNTIKTAKKWH